MALRLSQRNEIDKIVEETTGAHIISVLPAVQEHGFALSPFEVFIVKKTELQTASVLAIVSCWDTITKMNALGKWNCSCTRTEAIPLRVTNQIFGGLALMAQMIYRSSSGIIELSKIFSLEIGSISGKKLY